MGKLVIATDPAGDDPSAIVVGWACEGCGKGGAITLHENWDTWGVMHEVEEHHAKVSPDCQSIEQYPV